MNNIDNWNEWKNALGKAVNLGESVGLSDTTINNIAAKVGGFLSENIEPRNDEEKLLKELWNVGNNHDKHVLAKLVVKMTQK